MLVVTILLTVTLIPATEVAGDTSQVVTITISASVIGLPSGLILTYVNDYTIGIDWTKGAMPGLPAGALSSNLLTMIRVKWGGAPSSRTDGYEVYHGEDNTWTDNEIDLTSLTKTPWYGLFSHTVFYDDYGGLGGSGNIVSDVWYAAGIFGEANFMSLSWVFATILGLAIGLLAIFGWLRWGMIGFAAGLAWFFAGILALDQSPNGLDVTTMWGAMAFFFMLLGGLICFFPLIYKPKRADEKDDILLSDLERTEKETGDLWAQTRIPRLRGTQSRGHRGADSNGSNRRGG